MPRSGDLSSTKLLNTEVIKLQFRVEIMFWRWVLLHSEFWCEMVVLFAFWILCEPSIFVVLEDWTSASYDLISEVPVTILPVTVSYVHLRRLFCSDSGISLLLLFLGL